MTLVAMLTIAATGKAMSYEQARNEALFLTDKMAYELNLTDAQYEAAYEINLDYLMGVTSYDDVYSTYWERRNLDMSYILLDWQWQAFINATYFYRPLYWDGGYWHFGIYARYPHRDYFYFGRPVFYATYRGGHAWHHIGGHGYYHSHRDHYRPAGHSHFGMLDRWNRGDYRYSHHSNRPLDSNYGGHRHSSSRSTVNNDRSFGHRDSRNSGGNSGGSNYGRGNGGHSNGSNSHNGNNGSNNGRDNGRSFGHSSGSSSSSATIRNSRNFERSSSSSSMTHHPSASESRPSRSNSSFSGSSSRSNNSSFSNGSSSSRSSSSFSSGSSSRSSSSSGSFSSGSSHSSSGGSHSSSGGRSFGGRR